MVRERRVDPQITQIQNYPTQEKELEHNRLGCQVSWLGVTKPVEGAVGSDQSA